MHEGQSLGIFILFLTYLFSSVWQCVSCHFRGAMTSETGDGWGLTLCHPEIDAFWPSWPYWNTPVKRHSVDFNLLLKGLTEVFFWCEQCPNWLFFLVFTDDNRDISVCCLKLSVMKMFISFTLISTYSLIYYDKCWFIYSLGKTVH